MYFTDYLSNDETIEINRLINRLQGEDLTLQALWHIMDQIWDEMQCDNKAPDIAKLKSYYQHPVWLLNGLFIENHDVSLKCRAAISDWIVQEKRTKILDFGGGFGTLARMIAEKSANAVIDIYEPFPAQAALKSCQGYSNIAFVNQLESEYQCLVSTDILEHVPDPLSLLAKMISLVEVNGYLIIANHFYPSIKCHLPETFHLRFSFNHLATAMGLKMVDYCHGSHATIYLKTSTQPIDWVKVRQIERQSRRLFILREFNRYYVSAWRIETKKIIANSIKQTQQILNSIHFAN
ncbi:class I SAM-dependent methyltransferase [Phormidium tenue]|nr:methyltransferase domain-containing protein [Phormidium tenue]MBD2230088.1 methyltransferase domain-containing protein [Phormidium tenue FACHB-1052]